MTKFRKGEYVYVKAISGLRKDTHTGKAKPFRVTDTSDVLGVEVYDPDFRGRYWHAVDDIVKREEA